MSRATPVFVRRLFEREVPEIYNGIIEIKAIARDPGERCKIAVYSHNENIDPIGACIGPRGSRVQTIIEELHGEKIDIFEWSDNISELIANALSPSVGVAVIPNENVKDGLIVVVPDNQLSLAIGKRGKNARLAVKLTNHKIDIKSESEMQELGIDYMAISAKMQEEYEEKKAKERAYKQQQKIEELKSNETDIENIDVADLLMKMKKWMLLKNILKILYLKKKIQLKKKKSMKWKNWLVLRNKIVKKRQLPMSKNTLLNLNLWRMLPINKRSLKFLNLKKKRLRKKRNQLKLKNSTTKI